MFASLIENDSAPTIKIFELFKQTVFIDADENCDDGDDKEVGGRGEGVGGWGGGGEGVRWIQLTDCKSNLLSSTVGL